MVAEALTLVGLNFPQSKEGARSQNPGGFGLDTLLGKKTPGSIRSFLGLALV